MTPNCEPHSNLIDVSYVATISFGHHWLPSGTVEPDTVVTDTVVSDTVVMDKVVMVPDKVFYGQDSPSGESTTTICGVNDQLYLQ